MRQIYGLLQILLCLLIFGGSTFLLLHFVGGLPSTKLEDWANFATAVSVSLSIISVIYIYLTYRSQVRMSSVVQFESTFFQWYQIHTNMYKEMQSQIDECVDNVILPKLLTAKFEDLTVFEELVRNNNVDRPLHRYYRSMYQLLKYIKLSPILSGYKQRKKYYDIIQSNMSDKELLLFLCFVLGDENRDKHVFGGCWEEFWNMKLTFKELVDEGHILKNCFVPDDSLLKRMTPIVRKSFPHTAVRSFHFLLIPMINLEIHM